MASTGRETEGARRARISAERNQDDPIDLASRVIVDSNGCYSVAFPTREGAEPDEPVQLKALEEYPGLAEALAHGFALRALSLRTRKHRYYAWQGIKTGFLRFLAERAQGKDLQLQDIDRALLTSFKAWLDDPDSEGFAPSKITRRIKFQELQLILGELMRSSKWAPHLPPKLKLMKNPYPNIKREINHTQILDDATLEQLCVAAATECEAIIKQCKDDELQLAAAKVRPAGLHEIRGDPIRCAAYMLSRYPEPFPAYRDLISSSVRFQRAVSFTTYAQAERILYPDLDELLPFILLLTLTFAFNTEVVLKMTHRDYETETLFGRERIRLKPYKPRAHRTQSHTVLATDDYDNPRTLFRHLKQRCTRVRNLAPVEYRDRIFIRFSRWGRRGVPLEATDHALRRAIDSFCDRRQIDSFRIRQIRPTTLDLVHEITGGNLLAMQQVANHQDPQTTLDFYTRDAFKRRNEEMLAMGMEQYARKVRTGGAVDPTTRYRLHTDLGCATPGFICLNPRDSPIPGQPKGALCEAYGRCPICPLAAIEPDSEHSFAYLLKLRQALDEAAGRLGSAWLARWAPVKEKLTTHWAPLFVDEQVRRKGTELAAFTIPDFPRLN